MMKTLLALLFLSNLSFSQTIDPIRVPTWNVLGSNYESWESSLTTIDFQDVQTQNGFSVCQTFDYIFSNFISGKVILPGGEISISCAISIPSNFVLEGSADSLTRLNFINTTEINLISATGSMGNEVATGVSILKGVTSLTNSILASSLAEGDLIYIADTDDSLVVSAWANGWTGQFLTISAISNDLISFENSLRRSFANATIYLVNPVEKVGIRNLEIVSTFPTVGQTKNIFFDFARDCFVECISSVNCNFSHITLNRSSKVTVRNSRFKDAHAYGGGGQGYGVVCQVATGDCLIENNFFDHLRHSMLLQIGANGNVYGYNYSINPFWTGVSLPSNSAGDLVLHGDYTYMNLFEGNVGQHIVIDDSHGKNGPYNTFLRNRLKLYGIFMNNAPATDSVNFIGNEITNSGFLLGNFATSGNGHFSFGNNKQGTVTPVNTQNVTIQSLYNPIISDFYQYESAFPPIGYPNTLNQHKTYSEFQVINNLSLCDTYLFNSIKEISAENQIMMYPNPTASWVTIQNEDVEIESIRVVSQSGQEVFFKTGNSKSISFSVANLSKGMYFVEITDVNLKVELKKLVVE